jgi:hypothetical protein
MFSSPVFQPVASLKAQGSRPVERFPGCSGQHEPGDDKVRRNDLFAAKRYSVRCEAPYTERVVLTTASAHAAIGASLQLLLLSLFELPRPRCPVARLVLASTRIRFAAFPARQSGPVPPHAGLLFRGCVILAKLFDFLSPVFHAPSQHCAVKL